MAISHGQYRDRRASNIAQLIFVWLTHALLPLFRRRAPRDDHFPLFRRSMILSSPIVGRRVPCGDPPLPIFRRRVLKSKRNLNVAHIAAKPKRSRPREFSVCQIIVCLVFPQTRSEKISVCPLGCEVPPKMSGVRPFSKKSYFFLFSLRCRYQLRHRTRSHGICYIE